jgi:hypothetical protein
MVTKPIIMKKIVLLFVIAISCAACSGTKKVVNSGTAATISASDRDGSSYEKAVIVTEKHEMQGINAEYAWIQNKYPGYKTVSQSLNYKDKTPYDIIHILTADGKAMAIYFDISNYFGK